MLQNTRVTAFTISELFKGKLPPPNQIRVKKTSWGIETLTLSLLRNLMRFIYISEKLEHSNVLITFITAGKSVFIEYTKMGWGNDLLFKNKY